jgi:hypothetical protein
VVPPPETQVSGRLAEAAVPTLKVVGAASRVTPLAVTGAVDPVASVSQRDAVYVVPAARPVFV